MEIGNYLFGNSRGNYPVPRHSGYEEVLWRLFESIAPKQDEFDLSYGVDFTNDTFSVRRYYWGDCMCGFENACVMWEEKHSHDIECYQTEYWERSFVEPDEEWASELCARHGIDWNDGLGSATHCTCGLDKIFEEWISNKGHADSCPIILPNFYFKPENFSLNWYKYPLRDAYMSDFVSLGHFEKIIDKCIASFYSMG